MERLKNKLLAPIALFLCPIPLLAQPQTSNELQISEIIVTAQKQTQNILDVPASISAVTLQDLVNARAFSLSEMQQLAPNFSFEANNGFSNLNIRGVGGGGRNIGFETRAGAYLDGVYIGQPGGLNQSLHDIDQIEVLRGPQGYLFGRNTVSGAISITTQMPSEDFSGKISAGMGDDDRREGFVTLSGPIIEDQISARLSAGYETKDGEVKNLHTGSTLEDFDRKSVRAKVLWQLNAATRATLSADHSSTETTNIRGEAQTGFFGSPITVLPPRQVNFDTTPHNDTELSGLSLTVELELSPDQQITSITGYRETKKFRINDTDYNPIDILSIRFNDESEQISQELRFNHAVSDTFNYMAGLYLLGEQADTARTAFVGQHVGLPVIPTPLGPASATDVFGVLPGGEIPANASLDTGVYAIFSTVHVDISAPLSLDQGLRYSHEDKDLSFDLDGTDSAAFQIATLPDYRDDHSEDQLSWSIALGYTLHEQHNTYARVSTGYKSGGWNVDFLNAGQVLAGFDFDTEEALSYELGIKGRLAEARLQYDLAVFYSEYDDFQIFQFVELAPSVSVLQLRNAAEVRSQGLEGSLVVLLSNSLKVGGNIGLIDAEFKDFVSGGDNYSGNELPNAPHVAGLVYADYYSVIPALSGSLSWYIELAYRGESYSEASNNDVIERQDQRTLLNMQLRYTASTGDWMLTLWGKNLLDEQYIIDRSEDFLQNQILRWGPSRSLGAQISYQF